VGIFSFDKPSLLIRDPDLVKNIIVKDFQNFMDRTFSVDDTFDPLVSKNLGSLKGQIWRHLRTNLTAPFSLRKIKMMFYLVDICGKELAYCLEKATAGGKLPARYSTAKTNGKIKLQKLQAFQGYKVHPN
jgi:hypothetical protein